MNSPAKNVRNSDLKMLGLICFVRAALAVLICLTDMASMMTTLGLWMHFRIPTGLFILNWMFQHLGRRIK